MPTTTPRALPPWLRDLERVDLAVYAAILRTDTPALDAHLRRLTHAANYSRLWIASAAIVGANRGPAGRRAAATGIAAVGLTSAVANLVLKPLGGRRRPDPSEAPAERRAPMPASTSFPSGHSASAFAFATAVGSVLPIEAIPIRALATAVGYSRVHTGLHYPADVIAGAALGTVLAQLTVRAMSLLLQGPTTK